MLDKKTQNRDARIELLEDRDRQLKLFFVIMYIFAWICVLFMGIFMIYYETVAIMFVIVAIGSIIIAAILELGRAHLDTLIYLKKHLENNSGQKKQETQEQKRR